jgi:hypothetical protein
MPYVEYDEVQATCSDCGRSFPSDEALAAHRAASHAIEDVTAPRARASTTRRRRRPAQVP